jgi:hypothetical protein
VTEQTRLDHLAWLVECLDLLTTEIDHQAPVTTD